MPNKKVTLSINAQVYKKFKEFCEENAIMLSKKIELIMKDIMKDSEENKEAKNEN